MSHAIYTPQVLTPTLMRTIQSHSPKVAADLIADLVIQIQEAAYRKGTAAGRSQTVGQILNAMFADSTTSQPQQVSA